jgi:O-antigen ligase
VASATYPSDVGAAARLAGSNSANVLGRVDRWRMAVPAVGDRPVLGIGPGLYRRATSPHDTVAAARAFGADSLYQDAHNVLVEYVVTVGIVGLLAFLVWVALAAIGARGELAWFAAFGGLSLLLQPQFIGLTPVLALAFGAAAPRDPPTASNRAVATARAIAVTGAVVGVVVAVLLVRGDWMFRRAVSDGCPATAHRAMELLPQWPEPALYAAGLETADRGCSPGGMRRAAIRDVQTAIRRDPSSPTAWTILGDLQVRGGDAQAARRAYQHALYWNPQSTLALAGLAGVARDEGRTGEMSRLCRRLHVVLPRGTCPPARR